MDLSTNFYIVALIMVFLSGVSKTGLAAGFGSLCVPMLSLFVSPAVAAGILLPLFVVFDSSNIWTYRKFFQVSYLKILIPGAIMGIICGAMVFNNINPSAVKLIVGLIAVTFAMHYFFKGLIPSLDKKMPIKFGYLAGMISGFTSHLAHAGGPPVRVFLLNQDLKKSQFVGTFGFFFAVVNLIKVIPYVYFGQINWDTVLVSLKLAPVIPLGVLVGVTLHKSLSEAFFTKLAYILLTFTGVKLIIDGVLELL